MQYLGEISKMTEWSLFVSRANHFSITVIQLYAPASNAEDAEQFYENLQDLVELTPKKDVFFILGDWNAKVGIKKHLESRANLALECRMKQGKD